jgi:hypothetical protein
MPTLTTSTRSTTRHITILLSLVWTLLAVVSADVLVLTSNETFADRIAAFGPRLDTAGLDGFLISVDFLRPTKDAWSMGWESVPAQKGM